MANNIFELNVNLMYLEKSEAKEALRTTAEGAANQQSNTDNKKEGDSKLKKSVKWAGKQSMQIVKQIAVYDLNKAGSVYGDTARQNEIDNMMTTAAMGQTIASMTATGAQIGGGWGAIIGLVLGTVGEVIQGAQRAYEYKIEQQNNQREASYAQERLGILAACKGR